MSKRISNSNIHRSAIFIPLILSMLILAGMLVWLMGGARQTAFAAALNPQKNNLPFIGPEENLSPEEEVQQAWERAQQSGSYDFRSNMTQTTDPALSLMNAGREKEVNRLFIDGSVDRPANRLDMDLWQNSRAGQALSVKVENGQTFGRMGESEWQEIENIGDLFAPGGDPLGFLSGAVNIQAAGTETRAFSDPDGNDLALVFDVYSFDFDGGRFAAHMQTQMESALRQQGKLPPGMSTEMPTEYRQMSGQGQIWLDADGLPRYVEVDLVLPPQANGDRVTATVESELHNFDLERIAAAQATLLGNTSTWLKHRIPSTSASWRDTLIGTVLWSFMIIIAIIILRYWNSKKLYAGLASVMIISMVVTPLLQSNQAAAFYSEQEVKQAEQEQTRAKAEKDKNTSAHLQKTSINPHQNPLETTSEYALEQAYRDTYPDLLVSQDAPTFAVQASTTITTTDTDNDGLSDADETTWRTCAYAGAPDFCDGVADPTDSDGDGLSDGDEVNRIGTEPTLIDTDGDSITDTVEIAGYVDGNGVAWYLDAYEMDTNNDGLLDGVECPAWSSTAANPAPGSPCPDTDGDGTPDIFDADNDGDGVEDSIDTSPFTPATEIFNQDNPFSLNVSGLTVDTPVFVNLQMRPEDPEHLSYFGMVMDWPSRDNDGQIQRVLDTTWANTSDTSSRSTASDASYGDMRLVPYLEVSIPYSSGHYGNLPVKDAYQGTTRSLNDSVDDWLDTSVTEAYGLSVQDADDSSGDLLIYAPLALVSDCNGGGDVAFGAQIPYWPSQGSGGTVDWGSDHSFRLVWFVQMLTDACPADIPDCEDSERVEDMSVVHVYDDDWHLAGLEIVEDRGLEVGIMYEDPAQDANLEADAQLWNASWLLGASFLRGRDCPTFSGTSCEAATQDGQRDVTIANAVSYLNSLANDAGDLSYLEMATFSYEHEGFLAHVMMTETLSLLENQFSAYADQTIPTLLFLTERTRRSFNLDDGGVSNSLFSADFDPAGTDNDVPEIVMASMSWASYYDADDSASVDWQSYAPDDYLEYLDWQLQSDDFFTAASNAAEDIDEAEGKRLWAQIYYIALYSGASGMVEVNGETAWAEDPDLPEVEYASWPSGTFYGFTFVAFSVLYSIKPAVSAALKSGVSFWRQLKYAFSYNYSFYTSNVERSLKTLGRATVFLTAITVILIVTGLTLFAIGFFGGDESTVETAVVILNYANLIVLSAWLFSILRTFVMIVRVSSVATNSMRVFFGLTSSLAKSSRVVGTIGLVLAVAVTWGFFIYMLASGQIQPGTIEFNIALALAIAQTIVIIILFIFEIVFGLVATIILLLVFIIDAILAILGETGIVDWLTETIAKWLYDIDYVIFNLDDPDRLDLDFKEIALSDPDEGFTTANGLYVTMEVTTTLDTVGVAFSFFGEELFNADGKRATFRYSLTQDETNIHSDLKQNDMSGEWSRQDRYIVAVQETTNTSPIPLSAVGTGINVDLNDKLYLNEGAVIPYEGCWQVFWFDVDCTWYDTKTTNNIHVGEYLVFDILPTTIGQFVSLNWSGDFPAQHDYDNDGMLSESMGGVDPNDGSADIDGDGLSDTYELTVGTDPQKADTDGDGLTDSEEITHKTNPLSADSDGDGLDDYTEVIAGWLVVYDSNNNLTRIWSDPSSADADNDTLTDLEEFVFGFNPWVATDPSIINNLIAFDDISVHEANAPMMLFQFEEYSGSEIFNDDLGRGYTATCSGNECPTAGESGELGNAVDFDGTNDNIQISNVDLSDTSFSVAGWVYRRSTISIDPLFDVGDFNLVFLDTQRLICSYGSESVLSNNTYSDNQWLHWACVYDQDAATLSLYVNGVLDNSTLMGGTYSSSGTMILGENGTFHLDGKLDEIGVYQTALSENQIAALYDHRYVNNDLLVAPGDPLLYQATISNTHPSQSADGLMSAATRYFDPAIGVPDVVLGFESAEKESTFIDGVGQSSTATCLSDLTCPETGADGNRYTSIEFDGVDDYILMPPVGDGFDEYTLAFWINVSSLPISNTYILDTESEEPGALDIYLTPSGTLIFDVAGGDINFICRRDLNNNLIDCTSDPAQLPEKPETAFSLGGGNLNQWWFFGVLGNPSGADVYINPDNNDSSQLSFSVTPTGDPITQTLLGPGVIGNSIDFDAPLDARFDDLVFYNERVASPSATNNKELSEKVYQGNYWFDYVGYSAKAPTFILDFNEVGLDFIDAQYFIDHQQASDHAFCESAATCPTRIANGYDGRAIELDGVDDYAAVYNNIYRTGTIDMSFYVKLDALPAVGEAMYIFDSASTADDTLDIYIDSDGLLYLERKGASTVKTCFSIPCDHQLTTGTWHKVRILISNKWDSGNKEYAYDIWIDDQLARDSNWCSAGGGATDCHTEQSRIGGTSGNPGLIGHPNSGTIASPPTSFTGAIPFDGQLDQFSIGIGNYTFDVTSMEIGYYNAMNDGLTAHCPSVWACPAVDSGVFGKGALFDGVEDYLTHDRLDFVQGDYTLAAWFQTGSSATQTILAAIDPTTGNPGVLLQIQSGALTFTDRFPVGTSGGGSVTSSGGYADGGWHHVVAIKEDDALTLIVDGVDTYSAASSNAYGDTAFDVQIGGYESAFFDGSLDELVIIPSAVANGDYNAAQVLMNAPYPAIHINEDFNLFNAPAQSTVTVEGSAEVDADAVNSFSFFDQEVEAALQLQSTLDYPILDGNAANLIMMVPFEEVPNSTLFLNVDPDTTADFTCSGNNCPVSGLRGKVGRTAFFDGQNDYLYISSGTNAYPNSTAVWVYGDRGTIMMTDDYDGMELDFNRFRAWYKEGSDNDIVEEVIPLDLPENTWTHLIATFDETTGAMKVYVNGALYDTANIGTGASGIDRSLETIGANTDTSDPFHGYIDDLRLYSNVLSDAQALTLYTESTAQLHFEFDEDENAAVFLDKSVNELVAEPLPQVCYNFELVSMSVNTLANDGSTINFLLDDSLLASKVNISIGAADLNNNTLLCDSGTLEVTTAYSGTTTSLGTVLVSTTPVTTTTNFSGNGNDIAVTYAVDAEPVYRVNPSPGTDGKIGNTALFDGDGYLTVEGAQGVTSLANDFTIMFWMRPDSLTGRQRMVASARTNSINGFGLGLDGSQLLFTTWGNEDLLASTTEIESGVWQHVTLVFDSSNNALFYVDGALQETVAGTFPVSPNLDDVLMIGGTTTQLGSAVQEIFHGQIDELQIYNRSLSGSEIFAFYLRELRWYRDRGVSIVKVDADSPSLTLLGGEYYANQEIDLVVSAVDATSNVDYLDYALKAPSDSSFSDWQSVSVCTDAAAQGSSAAWCLTIDPTTLDGEGKYELEFRGYDAAGNETEIQEAIWVDDTPPDVNTVYVGQWIPVTDDPQVELAWTLTVTGTVSDPDIGSDPGSGVLLATESTSKTLQVTLYDSNLKKAGDGTLVTNVVNGAFSAEYRFAGQPPHGVYSVDVSIADNVGNVSASLVPGITRSNVRATTTISPTLKLDARAPSAEANLWNLPVNITQSLTISGSVIDAMDPGGSVVQYHFEETSSPFYDSSYAGNHAFCSTCPTLGATGQFGNAVQFTGTTEFITIPHVINPISDTFSAAMWVNVDDVAIPRVLLSQQNGTGTGSSWLLVNTGGNLVSYLGGAPLTGSVPLVTGQWHHVAVTYDGTTLRIYLDAALIAEDERPMEVSDGDHIIGLYKDLATNPFSGRIDELILFNRALSASDVYAIAQSEAIGVNGVDVWVETFPFTGTLDTPAWDPATLLGVPGDAFAGWEYSLPTGLEDYYRIHLQATDLFGNTSRQQRIWRGIIDQIAPRIAFTITAEGYGSAASTTFDFRIDDKFLDEDSLTTPCANSTAPLQFEYHPHTGLPIRATGSCQVNGIDAGASASVAACDVFGRCTTVSDAIPSGTPVSSVLIREPEEGAELGFLGGSVPIEIGAFAIPGNIETLTVADQNGNIDSLDISGTLSDTIWATPNWTPTTTGTYTLTATMTDTLGGVYSDSAVINFIPMECFAEINGDTQTDFGSLDASAVQQAVDAAVSGATIKLSGNCAGVQARAGLTQTIYISKTLTLEGGHIPDDWLAVPDAVAFPTTLDAENAGRVVYVADGDVTISTLQIISGTAPNGSGIYNLGNLTVISSTIASSTANTNGGGIYNNGALTLTQSAIISNTATIAGGGVYNLGVLAVTNSILSGNNAQEGGGLVNGGVSATLTHVTLVDNQASAGLGTGISNTGGALTLTATALDNISNECNGSITDAGYNLASDDTCGFNAPGSANNTDSLLGPLADNSGPTQSHLPQPFSPVIDALPVCGLSTDQRGVARPVDGACDIGAVELELNYIPLAVGETYTTSEDIALIVNTPGVLGNDMDGDADPLNAVLDVDVLSGTINLSSTGAFTYTPDSNICGVDRFSYHAADETSTSNSVTVTLNITCLPPTGDAGGPYFVDEGGSVLLDGSGSFEFSQRVPGLTYTWDYDYDGITFDVDGTGITTTFSAVGLDGPNGRVVALRVTDYTNLTDTVTSTLTIENVAPSVALTGTNSISETLVFNLDLGGVADPGLDTVTACTLAWGDGDSMDCLPWLGGTITHTYADGPLTPTIQLDLTDEDGLHLNAGAFSLDVTNLPPVITELTNNGPITEGQSVTIIVAASDPAGQVDPLLYAFDCDGDLLFEIGPQINSTANCTYADDGVYGAIVQVDDGDGGVVTATTSVAVSNAAPMLSDLVITNPIFEGDLITLTGTISDPGTTDAFTLTVAWDDGETDTFTYPPGTSVFSETHIYLDDNPSGTPEDSLTLTLGLSDGDGGSDAGQLVTLIQNIAPTVEAGPDQIIPETASVHFTGTFTDPGTDIHTILWDFGDGLTATDVLTPTHTYSATGTYTTTLTVTDDDTGVGTDMLVVTIKPVADLSLIKSESNDPVLAGATFVYTLTASNAGPSEANHVVVTDTLPTGITFDSASVGCIETGDTVVCDVGTLPVGLSTTIHITTTVWLTTTGTLTNTAWVHGEQTDSDLSNNMTTETTEAVPYLIVYEEDFEENQNPGDEWNCTAATRTTAPNGENFLGEFGAETVCLTLGKLPQHTQVTVAFDLYLIRSWDGNRVEVTPELRTLTPDIIVGPDRWQLWADSAELMDTTFSNWPHFGQAYPGNYPDGNYPALTGAKDVNIFGYTFGGMPMDAVYHFEISFEHADLALVLDFIGMTLQDIQDESWGIDNVVVYVDAGAGLRGNIIYLPMMMR